jgi:DNA-binding SARP family transcriptional activator
MLAFSILGPLEVLDAEHQLPLRGKRLRTLVVALLLHARELRTGDQLIDDLWAERAPTTARALRRRPVLSPPNQREEA